MREGLALKFEGVEIDQHVDRLTLTLDLREFVSNVSQNTGKQGLRTEDLLRRLRPELRKRQHLSQVCSGHDVIRIVALGLRRRLGSCSFQVATPSNVEAMLRMAYDSIDFQETSLYRAIKDWEARNLPFIVLAF
jgi:hypothetical protein